MYKNEEEEAAKLKIEDETKQKYAKIDEQQSKYQIKKNITTTITTRETSTIGLKTTIW